MKKYLSLALALIMVLSLSATAFAAENPEAATTSVSYTGNGIESYTITVPSSMAPGDTGNVKVDGTWATNRKIVVTAPETVTLTNDIDGGQKTLALTFEGLDETGDNTVENHLSASISVEGIDNALFGTWSGNVEFSVSMEDDTLDISTVLSNPRHCEGYASVTAPSGMNLVLRKYYYESRDAAFDEYTKYEDTAMTEKNETDYYGNNYVGSYSSGGYARCVILDASGTYAGEVDFGEGINRFMFVS